jgi:hypothetical protein
MAIIYKRSLFSWKDVESLGDLERLKLVLENLPDENLMCILEKKRKQGRNDDGAAWEKIKSWFCFKPWLPPIFSPKVVQLDQVGQFVSKLRASP